MKGLELCRGFFFDIAKPLLDRYFPALRYTAGLIGYGSDVLGYDDEVSRDHMWGPRFYLFLSPEDISRKGDILEIFSEHFPYQYQGFSVNFTQPDPQDNGVRRPALIDSGRVDPLVFIETIDGFLEDEIGAASPSALDPFDWLAISEHRLLSLVSGTLFVDKLGVADRLAPLRYYPREVKAYLIASNWDIIASEQAFAKRCGALGDDIGSRLVCARIADRLMRLCFLYRETYAPYSKWFGTAFERLDVDSELKRRVRLALESPDVESREEHLVRAQALTADLHNQSGVTEPVAYRIESYFGRDIRVIFADKFAEKTADTLQGTPLEGVPLIGTLSQIGNLSAVADEVRYSRHIAAFYRSLSAR